MNVAEFLISIVEGLGVDRAFSLTGGMAMHISRAVASSSLRVVYGNHEQACVAAADGYARAYDHRRPGLAVVTSGPGVTNVLTSLVSAYHDSVPLIVLAGQVKTADVNRHGVRSYGAQEVPSLALTTPVTKRAIRYLPALVSDDELAEVIGASLSGRKGPVFIEVPLDVQPTTVSDAAARRDAILQRIQALREEGPAIASDVLADLRARFSAASRPVLFVGNGLRLAGINAERLRQFATRLGVPVLTTWPSVGFVGVDHPLHFGCPGGLAPTHSNRILQSADLVLFLGVRGDLLTTAFAPERFGKRARRYFIEIDPLETEKFRNVPEVTSVVADLAAAFLQIEDALLAWSGDAAWLAECRAWRVEDANNEAMVFGANDSLNARTIAGLLSDELRGVSLVTTASGYGIEGIARFFGPRIGNDMLYAGHCLGSMGLGLPTAVGAAAAEVRRVLCVEGDGGIMLNIQELLTLQANPWIPLSILLLNNQGYHSISRSQQRAFSAEFGASDRSGLALADFQHLALAFGYQHVLVTSASELRTALRRLMQEPTERVLIDVIMGSDDYRGPAVVTRFRDDGTPYTSDLEDISWSR
jgi:acetolactate synthase-1/2/3 large subunit